MEIEAKFLARDRETLAEVGRLLRLGSCRLVSGSTKRLRTTYLDTADHDFERERVGFRIRECEGRLEATLKGPGRIDGDVHERPERNEIVERWPHRAADLPDGAFRAEVETLAGTKILFPIVTTIIERNRRDLVPDGECETIADLALDWVEIRSPAGDVGPSFAEIEIELRKDGAREELGHLIRALRAAVSLEPSRKSKLERALEWVRTR